MGQYYKIVNVTKKQYLHPHSFNDGLKLMEFGASGHGTMMALALLLAKGNGRGGGDLCTEVDEFKKIIGSWAGDKIIVVGDYADEVKYHPTKESLYAAAENFENISYKMLAIFMEEEYFKKELTENQSYEKSPFKEAMEQAKAFRASLKLDVEKVNA